MARRIAVKAGVGKYFPANCLAEGLFAAETGWSKQRRYAEEAIKPHQRLRFRNPAQSRQRQRLVVERVRRSTVVAKYGIAVKKNLFRVATPAFHARRKQVRIGRAQGRDCCLIRLRFLASALARQ